MEVDLHIHHLVKSERGMSSHDKKMLQLDTAKHKLEFAMKKNIPKIVFIHGVGEGTLKIELEYLFGRYDNVKFYEADYKKYGQVGRIRNASQGSQPRRIFVFSARLVFVLWQESYHILFRAIAAQSS